MDSYPILCTYCGHELGRVANLADIRMVYCDQCGNTSQVDEVQRKAQGLPLFDDAYAGYHGPYRGRN